MNQTLRMSLFGAIMLATVIFVALHATPPQWSISRPAARSIQIGGADRTWGFQAIARSMSRPDPAFHRTTPAIAVVNLSSRTSLKARPSPAIAVRHAKRAEFAWFMRPLGADAALLDRLVDGDFAGAFKDLKEAAAHEDPSAIRLLGWMWITNGCEHPDTGDTSSEYLKASENRIRAGPPEDADWYRAIMQKRIAADRQGASACSSIDSVATMAQVRALAAQGDGASEYILAQGADSTESHAKLAKAALDGFAFAQWEAAWTLPDTPGAEFPSSEELVRAAADTLPEARARLAHCDFEGCEGAPSNLDAAARAARAAAQQGYPDEIIDFGPRLPLSLVAPDEPEAWALFKAALGQRGCFWQGMYSIRGLQMNAAAFASPKATPSALRLADQYWQQYGAAAMERIGC